MEYQILNMLQFSLGFGLLFGIAEYLYRFKKVEAEKTRKLVHIGSGLITMLFPIYFQSVTEVAILSLSFLGLLGLSKSFKLLPSINDVDRKTTGSYWFPLSVIMCFAAQLYFEDIAFYYLPLLTLTLADPAACLIGKKLPFYTFRFKESQKSVGGSIAFFFVAFALSLFFAQTGFQSGIGTPIMIASVAMTAEFFGGKGYDNITIPISCIAALYFLQTQTFIYYV